MHRRIPPLKPTQMRRNRVPITNLDQVIHSPHNALTGAVPPKNAFFCSRAARNFACFGYGSNDSSGLSARTFLSCLRRQPAAAPAGAAANSRSNWASRSFNEVLNGPPGPRGPTSLTLEIPGAHPHKRHRPRLQRSPTLRRPNPTPRPTDPSNTSIQIIQTLLNTRSPKRQRLPNQKRHRHPTSQSITLQLRQLRNAQPKSHRRHKTNVRETSDGPI